MKPNREANLKAGGVAAKLLNDLHSYEKESLPQMLQVVSQELGITPETLGNYATGQRPIPKRTQKDLLDALRSFRWKTDEKWKLATAVSELLGVTGKHFVGVDDFVVDQKPTKFKLMRLDRKGKPAVGNVVISPSGTEPCWWSYSYQDTDEATGAKRERLYEGPVFVVDKLVCVVCAGHANQTVGRYLRFDYVWPSAAPSQRESFGISMSTLSREGHPLAAPFALIPAAVWNEESAHGPYKGKMRDRLIKMASNGMISLFG